MTSFVTFLFILIIVLVLYVIAIYNGLVALKNRVKNSFAQIDVQLKRRYDLIPNLVETTRAYLKHERETLEAVVQARNQALAAEQSAAARPTDKAAVGALAAAESVLTQSLGKLLAVVESYPDLKANETIASLMEELKSTENRVAFSRQSYNDVVMTYNTKIESFPDGIVATQFRFKTAALWDDITPAEKAPVKVAL